ncbi:MAG: hypothetical protein HZB41_10000 [Ignavibacteriae bacterium]|nr:hypothetical protein [Ignavibacteriota bacterium]
MRNFKLLILILSSIIIVFLNSCSGDNPTNTGQQGNFTFLNVGDWWIYERYLIDSTGNISGNKTIDSTFITETETVMGKLAFKMKTVTVGSEDEENYCYTEGEKFFIHSDFVNRQIEKLLEKLPIQLPISLDDMWVKIADYTSNSWLVKIDTIPATEIVPGVTITGTFTINGEKGIYKNMTVNSKSLSAQEFKLIFVFDGFINQSVKQSFKITVHTWFDKKVGILLQTNDQSRFDIPLSGSYVFEGYERNLIRYNIFEIKPD